MMGEVLAPIGRILILDLKGRKCLSMSLFAIVNRKVFQVARRARFLPDAVRLEHVPFGLVQGN